jgi:hypothetical protein
LAETALPSWGLQTKTSQQTQQIKVNKRNAHVHATDEGGTGQRELLGVGVAEAHAGTVATDQVFAAQALGGVGGGHLAFGVAEGVVELSGCTNIAVYYSR